MDQNYSDSNTEGSWEIILGESYQKLEDILKKLSHDSCNAIW